MNKKSLNIEFLEHDNLRDELPKNIVELLHLTDKNLNNAYAPYSNFKVSCALQLANNKIVLGTNQENAAYPSGLCAERVAIFAAKSQYPDQKVEKLVITTEQYRETPFSPCGACRQVIAEYEHQQKASIEIILKAGNSKVWVFKSIGDLLPFSFNGDVLVKKG
jgi:cytidine deaminase